MSGRKIKTIINEDPSESTSDIAIQDSQVIEVQADKVEEPKSSQRYNIWYSIYCLMVITIISISVRWTQAAMS